MALFKKSTKEEDKKDKASPKASSKVAGEMEKKTEGLSYDVILHPRITEKATDVAEDHNVYTFDVDPRANKVQILEAVKELYGVAPLKVRTTAIPKKYAGVRGKNIGYAGGGKKAYVYLKEGDTIEFV